ncbi:MAG TPA: hypothetical protein PK816_00915 [Candidatus Cloacimonadota bacterium]|nr:hypothetical protein [Candidatus Cloacimonadota bacterium]
MISFMDKQSRDALQINYILAKIQTFSEPGARLHKNFKPLEKIKNMNCYHIMKRCKH